MPDNGPPPQVDFEDENEQNGAKALEYTRTLKIEYDPSEVSFWFTNLENEMYTCEVKSQWLKRCVLVKNLPPKVQADVKSLLTLKQSEAPADIYKQIKQEILRIHAPQKEDTYKKALSRVLVGLPSQLGQVLVNDICDKPTKLNGCCCAKAVYTLWCIQLPLSVRSSIANLKFDKDTYNEVFQHADKVFLSTKQTEMSAGVAALSVSQASGTGESLEVAAIRARNNRGGNSGRNPPKNKGNSSEGSGGGGNNSGSGNSGSGSGRNRRRHQSNPPFSCCDNHFRWGPDCWYCLAPLTCPWKDKVSARPEKKKNESK